MPCGAPARLPFNAASIDRCSPIFSNLRDTTCLESLRNIQPMIHNSLIFWMKNEHSEFVIGTGNPHKTRRRECKRARKTVSQWSIMLLWLQIRLISGELYTANAFWWGHWGDMTYCMIWISHSFGLQHVPTLSEASTPLWALQTSLNFATSCITCLEIKSAYPLKNPYPRWKLKLVLVVSWLSGSEKVITAQVSRRRPPAPIYGRRKERVSRVAAVTPPQRWRNDMLVWRYLFLLWHLEQQIILHLREQKS